MEEKLNILLIEDNPADAHLIDIYLRDAYGSSYTLEKSSRLGSGLELLAIHDFDIILVDLTLPDSSGIETFKDLHDAFPEKPVIVLTGLEDESVGITTVKLGAQDFLIKGKIGSKGLKRSINYSIERYKLLKSLSENARMLEEKTADLQREKHKLGLAQRLAHIGSWEWNVPDNIFTCSDELYHILGLEPGEFKITFEDFLNFVYPDEREVVRNTISRSLKKLQPFDFLHRIVQRDGSIRTVHSRGELLLDSKSSIIRIIGTEQDVTEKKKEEQLEQLAMVAVKSYNAVTISDKDGKIEWVNRGFTKLFGYRLEDVIGTKGEILKRGETQALTMEADFLKVLLEQKKPVSFENKCYSKKGREYWILTSLTPILNDQGEVEKIISIDSDISKQKNLEQNLIIANKIAEHSLQQGNKALEELHKAKLQLEESLKVKEEFLANMSHEIRTPMNAIVGFTNLLQKSELNAENQQYVNAIKTSGENLLVIINDILDFSKLESGKITFENIDFNLFQIVSTLIELMLPRAIEKNIKLSSVVDKKIPEKLTGDPTRLTQILTNLIGNAIKFTNSGGVRLSVVMVSENDEGIEIEFSVADTGIGIKEENLSRIFESFTQATSDTTRKYGGTGLGLTITKRLVEQQEGVISVKSRLGEGSVFIVRLKFSKLTSQNAIDSLLLEEEGEKFPLMGVRILLVEDNYLNQVLATKILDNWKCKVDVADNGAIAVEKVSKNNYDVVLMDIQLPEMDGYEATSHIRSKLNHPKSGIPIIAMTAHALADESEKCFKMGMNDYISKPFDENKLHLKICRALSKTARAADFLKENGSDGVSTASKRVTNLAYIEKIANGDQQFVLRMINVFLNQTPLMLDSMTTHLENRDWKGLKAIAHKVKPSVAFMGITEMEQLIGNIEDSAQHETFTDEIGSMLESARNICNEALEELRDEKKKIEGGVYNSPL
jgi:PAS domain S-box-containing protein